MDFTSPAIPLMGILPIKIIMVNEYKDVNCNTLNIIKKNLST